jgi:hypothetical protein
MLVVIYWISQHFSARDQAYDFSTAACRREPYGIVLRETRDQSMLYAILCYDSEDVVGSWTREEDAAALSRLAVIEQKLAQQGKLGPVARLMPTTSAMTLRKGREPIVVDGPFAETKEQLLGFFIVDCTTLEEAVEAAKDLGQASSTMGCYEIRPLSVFRPGGLPT